MPTKSPPTSSLTKTRLTALQYFALIALTTWAISLWFLSSKPLNMPPGPEIPFLDKVLHFGYFGLGGLFLATSIRLQNFQSKAFAFSLCLLISIGAIDEWHQSWIPGRSGNDLYDWIADAIGGFSGLLSYLIIHYWLQTHRTKS